VKKRSLRISGHLTSVTLEEPFWLVLQDIAKAENLSMNALAAKIDATRGAHNLSSALRLYVLQHLQNKN
jgi:predicted DNA-binding ribbon-helix-helix protein